MEDNLLSQDATYEDINFGESLYVYELSICETGEIYYVGIQTSLNIGCPPYFFHVGGFNTPLVEKIRSRIPSKMTIIKDGLTENIAEYYADKRIKELQREGKHLLCDYNSTRIVKEDFRFETVPEIWVSKAEQHYLNLKPLEFDLINRDCLSVVYIDASPSIDFTNRVYGGNYKKYIEELKSLLELNGSVIRSSQYAKSVQSWIYPGFSIRYWYERDQEKAIRLYGHKMPAYHLLDVIRFLKNDNSTIASGFVSTSDIISSIRINPINSRCPLSEIKGYQTIKNGPIYERICQENNGLKLGHPLYEKGLALVKNKKPYDAILLFDQARAVGFFAPTLYDSYFKVYMSLKDYDNAISIMLECIAILKTQYGPDRYEVYEEYENKILSAYKKKQKQEMIH